MLIGRGADWSWHLPEPGRPNPGTWIDLTFALDIYNFPQRNNPQPQQPALVADPSWLGNQPAGTGSAAPGDLPRPSRHAPPEVQSRSHHGGQPRAAGAAIHRWLRPCGQPAESRSSDRRQRPPRGPAGDRRPARRLGRLRHPARRPAGQDVQPPRSSAPGNAARIEQLDRLQALGRRENFYVAFALDGLAPLPIAPKTSSNTSSCRAWSEDLCELLIQPISADNKLGPVLHVVCKPNGGIWVERKSTPHPSANDSDAWKTLETAGIRYAATTPESSWRGEVAIPWSAIIGEEGDVPTLLRFNFTQHKAATGESATWAGPVDFGRDDAFTGLIYLRAPAGRGAIDIVRGH